MTEIRTLAKLLNVAVGLFRLLLLANLIWSFIRFLIFLWTFGQQPGYRGVFMLLDMFSLMFFFAGLLDIPLLSETLIFRALLCNLSLCFWWIVLDWTSYVPKGVVSFGAEIVACTLRIAMYVVLGVVHSSHLLYTRKEKNAASVNDMKSSPTYATNTLHLSQHNTSNFELEIV